MALGDFKLFQVKSKEQRDKEAQEYALWAFPYGDLQKEKLTTLGKELSPKTPMTVFLTSFLTCKEACEKLIDGTETSEEAHDEAILKIVEAVRKYSQLIRKNEMTMYIALVLADAAIDENCEYPSADEMRISIQELNDIIMKNKPKPFWRK